MEESERENDNIEETPARSNTLPAPTHDSDSGNKAWDDKSAEIDVCSENFDPLRALYAPSVPLPFPNIKCFNNVAEYEGFLRGGRGRAKPENVEKKRLKAMKGVVDPERIARLKKLMVNTPGEEGASSRSTPRARRHKPQKNVLTRMPLCKGSPLGELYRCVEEKIRVKVHIRTFKGLRGVCSGFVVAFDRYWNLAMVDVDETYREPLFGEALYHEKALTISRLFEKLKLQESSGAADQSARRGDDGKKESSKSREERRGSCQKSERKDCEVHGKVHTRHINQLFIRGENVVLVNPQPL
ncbi:U7 snRNA-associated Sm-like protein LSm11 [Synchiropus splendidus]|uniref:U7 snRNA-associated Sm-like protein LSm11 n=1 Tax=Synchiropus splendidus TaxID=270530 RepID=UPI00237D40C9|nr:U7 snRNA-associated Sm-like protein LSm11 [Synchiropus splendidus]